MNKKVSIIYFAYDPKLFLKKRILNKMFVDKNVSVKQGHKRDLQISSNTLDLRIVFTPDN